MAEQTVAVTVEEPLPRATSALPLGAIYRARPFALVTKNADLMTCRGETKHVEQRTLALVLQADPMAWAAVRLFFDHIPSAAEKRGESIMKRISLILVVLVSSAVIGLTGVSTQTQRPARQVPQTTMTTAQRQ